MRRLRRAIFTSTAAVSLLLCIASAVLWVRLDHSDCLQLQLSADRNSALIDASLAETLRTRLGYVEIYRIDTLLVGSDKGYFFVARRKGTARESEPGVRYSEYSPSTEAAIIKSRVRSIAGVRITSNRFGPYEYRGFSVATWPIVLLTAVLPFWIAARVLRRRLRRPTGHCAHCGYNLTGNISGKCPECGTPVSTGSKLSA